MYTSRVLTLVYSGSVKAGAHITNGGLMKNVARILPGDLTAELDAVMWHFLPVFGWLLAQTDLSARTFAENFNCGIGFVFVVSKDDQSWKTIKEAVQIGNTTFLFNT